MPPSPDDADSVMQALATYELLNDEVTARLSGLRTASERIETKATFLAGFAVTASTVLLDAGPLDWPRRVVLVLFGLAFASSVFAFAVWRWDEPPHPQRAIEMYAKAPRIEALAGIVGTKAQAYADNQTRQELKANAWYAAAGLLAVALLVLLVTALT